MSKRESLLRYIHIVNKLCKAPASFEGIDEYLLQQSEREAYRFNVSKRQFQRDLKYIGSWDDREESRIRIKIYITHDFLMEILSFGEQVKVIQPEELILSIKAIFRKALKLY